MSKRSQRRKKAKSKQVNLKNSAVQEKVNHKKPEGGKFERFFFNHYHKLIIITLIILLLGLFQIGLNTVQTGSFINKGISLAGGSTINIDKEIDINALEEHLSENFNEYDFTVREITTTGENTVIIETTASEEEPKDEIIKSISNNFVKLENNDYSVEIMGASLGEQFFRQALVALIVAFILMGTVVFIFFRNFTPSIAVILSAFSDIFVTMAIVNILGIRLSTAGIAGFLMLIGYSVDTDILLNSKMLKGGYKDSFKNFLIAFKTGTTMSITTIGAVGIALIFTTSTTIRQVMTIIIIGLIVDYINTWIQNTVILKWHLQKKAKKGGSK
ncbi:MAG: protein translocase subunit SecF [Nanobdellota archaeon]